jgi:hypothetical protein
VRQGQEDRLDQGQGAGMTSVSTLEGSVFPVAAVTKL